jgi:Tol biopolymer transport system component
MRQVFVVPVAETVQTPSESAWIDITDGTAEDREAYWSPDGALLYFLSGRDGFRCIWARRLHAATKQPEGDLFAVQHFHHARLSLSGAGVQPSAVGLSVAGDRLVFALGELTGNIWLSREAGSPIPDR